jgi:RNA polymerase sigma factor (sigma-70 family)
MEPQHDAASKLGVERAGLDIEALYLEHQDAMWGKALRMLGGDRHGAADAVQATMLKIISKQPTNVRSWEAVLVTAVERTILDQWKSAAHRREQLLIDGDAPLEGGWLGDDTLSMDPADVVEHTHERLASNASARQALADLAAGNPDAHYAYVQVKVEGRTSKEVATELGVSDSRVRQHVMKARSELRKLLEARGGER